MKNAPTEGRIEIDKEIGVWKDQATGEFIVVVDVDELGNSIEEVTENIQEYFLAFGVKYRVVTLRNSANGLPEVEVSGTPTAVRHFLADFYEDSKLRTLGI